MSANVRTVSIVDRAVGERIRSRRIEMDVSLHDLAATVGVTLQQMQKYKRGKNRVAAGRLYHIAAALQVPIGFFFEATGEPALPDEAAKPVVGRAFKDVDEAIKRAVDAGYGWPQRVASEVALIARDENPHGLSRLLCEMCDDANRRSHEAARYRNALRVLLNALGERPLQDGSEQPLDEAIRRANAALDTARKPASGEAVN